MAIGAALAPRLHERPGPDRRRAAQPRELGLHDVRLRRRLRRRLVRPEAVAMSAPFYKFGAFGDEASLVVAFLIGIGFGFFLERAGFGSAKKLVVAVLPERPRGLQGDVHRHRHRDARASRTSSWAGFLDLSLVYLVADLLGRAGRRRAAARRRLRGRRLLPRHVDRRDRHRQARRPRLRPRLRGGDARLRPRVPAREGALHGGRPRHEDAAAGARRCRTASSSSASC